MRKFNAIIAIQFSKKQKRYEPDFDKLDLRGMASFMLGQLIFKPGAGHGDVDLGPVEIRFIQIPAKKIIQHLKNRPAKPR